MRSGETGRPGRARDRVDGFGSGPARAAELDVLVTTSWMSGDKLRRRSRAVELHGPLRRRLYRPRRRDSEDTAGRQRIP